MKRFLQNIAQDLHTKYGDEVSDFCIVFPNRRAGLFFGKYFAELINKPLWSPHIITVNDLMQELSSLQLADRLTLLFELFHVYKQNKQSDEQFDDFFFWGETLLGDFDDIDKYLVNAADLFQNMASIKSIEQQFNYLTERQIEVIKTFWDNFTPPNSTHQDHFISIWEVLNSIYVQFQQTLVSKQLGYEGMIYKQVVDHIKSGTFPELPYKKVVFIGFNALNNCEEVLFTYLKNRKEAIFYWDHDHYYTNDPKQEAGRFIRENIKKYPPETTFDHDQFLNPSKKISIYAVPTETGQANLVERLIHLQEEAPDNSHIHTAIIMGDEKLLLPVLHALPASIRDVNVTLGYPLQNTPAFGFIKHLIELQKNVKINEDQQPVFYHQHVVNILNHQYMSLLNNNEVSEITRYIAEKNMIYLTPGELHINNIMKKIFERKNTIQEVSQYILDILYEVSREIETIQHDETKNNKALDKEFIYHLYKQVKRTGEIIKEQNIVLNLKTFLKLLEKVMRSQRVPFTGEPLAGIQIMGILETRNIDFDNIIYLSVNEGNIPKREYRQSYIPYNLRKGFGLPTVDHTDAMYAYYFYRSMQRAQNISLVYHTKTEGINKGEMSRYLYQLIYETGFDIKEYNIVHRTATSLPKQLMVEKNDEVLLALNDFLSPGGSKMLSPTALNAYLDCSLKFYFHYIAGLKEADEVKEEVDPMLFGNLLHKSIYEIYHPYLKQTLDKSLILSLSKNKKEISRAIDEAFMSEYYGKQNKKPEYLGKNIIVQHILNKFILQLLKKDHVLAPFCLEEMEQSYYTELPLGIHNNTRKARLGGKIDRIDTKDGMTRIIDYKTGEAANRFIGLDHLFKREDHKRNTTAFQLFYYCMLYAANNHSVITPAVYPLKTIYTSGFATTLTDGKKEVTGFNEYEEYFKEMVMDLLQDIFNPDIPFSQTNNTNICGYCPFIEICHR